MTIWPCRDMDCVAPVCISGSVSLWVWLMLLLISLLPKLPGDRI